VLLRALAVDDFTILLNSLGCEKDRASYKKALSAYLEKKMPKLCDDCKRRAQRNVLRVLDCKKEDCRKVVKDAPGVLDHLCGECLDDYTTLKKILTEAGVSFREKKDLVRGLDYYTKTIFEVVHPALGSQDAVAAGGRYDNLTAQMGGPDVGATGYAVGMERLLLIIEKKGVPHERAAVLVVPIDEKTRMEAFRVTNHLRTAGVATEMDHSGRSLKGQMRRAHKEGRRFVILLGEDEVKNAKVLVKDMEEGEQKELSLDEAAVYLKERSE
jgi:histidyl-tRNA synthetase